MRQVIANVSKYAAAEGSSRRIPIIEEDCVREFPKGSGKGDKESWGHDEAELVHWKIVMDSVEKEMRRDAYTIIWHVPRACSVTVYTQCIHGRLTYQHGTDRDASRILSESIATSLLTNMRL